VRSPERLTLLRSALEALDTATAANAETRRDGMTVVTPATGVRHVHPAVKVEKEARQLHLRLWLALGLNEGGTKEKYYSSAPPELPEGCI
jgi:hypothetical protein